MEFGYGLLTAQRTSGSKYSYEEIYQGYLDLAIEAEKSGFDTVWTSEHHFFDDGYSPSVLPFSAALAGCTTDIGIGTGIALAPLYDPIRLAEDAATVDLLSGGRFRLGLANGYMPHEFENFDIPQSTRAARTTEAIEICRRAWSGGSFSFDGQIYQYEDLLVEPKPEGSGPPIWLGGTSQPAVKRAANRADGHLGVVPSAYTVNQPERDREDVESQLLTDFRSNVELLAEHDAVDSDFEFALLQYGFVAESDDEAWEQMLPSFLYTRQKYAQYREGSNPDDWRIENLSDERLETLRKTALVGSPETVANRIEKYASVVPGELQMVLNMTQPKLSFEENKEAVRLFGSEILPRFD